MKLNGWVLNNTGCTLEFSKSRYVVTVTPYEDAYNFCLRIYDDSNCAVEHPFTHLNQCLGYIDSVLNDGVEFGIFE